MSSLSLEPNKQICEAEGCLARAEEEIKISVGQMGEINLIVCNDCKPKFTPTLHLEKSQHSGSKKYCSPRPESCGSQNNPSKECTLIDKIY